MHGRKNVVLTLLAVMCMVAAMIPAAQQLSRPQNDPQTQKDRMIVQSLEAYRDYIREGTRIAVQPPMEIERVWEIEDTREEAQDLLISRMHNADTLLGFDRESRTFYCTLGVMDDDADWPEISLSAVGAGGETVSVAWVDDYTYDYPADALRDEYRYELLAYTDTQYAYIGLIFTGMPIVSMDILYDGELTESYVPARVSVSSAQHDAIDSAALTHLRGGGVYKGIDKFSYRVEFHDEQETGRGKAKRHSVLGMAENTDWLLLSNAQEETAVRNYLAYDLWNRWNEHKPAPMMMESRLAELFINDEYMGIYQVMPPVNVEEEIVRMGGNLKTDSAVRMVIETNRHDRPNKSYNSKAGFFAECRYSPYKDPMKVFDDFDNYAKLSAVHKEVLPDPEFAALAEHCMDVEAIVSYYLFMQACGLGDNVFNNLYVWNLYENGRFVYRVSPWDMDLCLQETGYTQDGSVVPYYEDRMVLPQRLLDLNVGNARQILWDLWQEKRQSVLRDSEIERWIKDVEEYVNRSGAYRRESQKWRGGAYELSLGYALDSEIEHMWTIEERMRSSWPLDM